ncbi:hypothetical protein AAKU67_002863 [Oxalobacteraceae bacterium GrIS 2.11]
MTSIAFTVLLRVKPHVKMSSKAAASANWQRLHTTVCGTSLTLVAVANSFKINSRML